MDIENVTIKNHFEGDELYDYIKKYNVVNNDDLDFLDLGLADNIGGHTAGVLYEDVCRGMLIFSRKVLKDRGKADTMSASADCRHGCRL